MRTNRFFRTCAVVLSLGVFPATMTGCSQTPEETKVYTIEDTINRIKAARPNFVEEKLVPTVSFLGTTSLVSERGRSALEKGYDFEFMYIKGMGQRVIEIYSSSRFIKIRSMYYPSGKYLASTNWSDGLTIDDHAKLSDNRYFPIIGTIDRPNESTEYLLNPISLNLPLEKGSHNSRLAYQYKITSIPKLINSNQIVSFNGEFIDYNILWGKDIPNTKGSYIIKIPAKKEVWHTKPEFFKEEINYVISTDNVEEANQLTFNKKQGNYLYLTYRTYKKGGYKAEHNFYIPNKENYIFTCGQDKFRLNGYYKHKDGYEAISITPIELHFNNKDLRIGSWSGGSFQFQGYINQLKKL